MTLDIDPFEITSWESYAKDCLAAGELWRFKRALSEYIYITNRPCFDEITVYANRRHGEFMEEDLRKKVACVRKVKELYLESVRMEKIQKLESEIADGRKRRP